MNEFTGFEGQRVLVVDDHAISRDYASAALRQSGMSVKATCTVAAALEAIDFHPDVVVCDWRLPDGTGRGVYDAIRAAWSGRRTPPRFVLLCGNPEDIPLNWLKQAEIERVLRKPCSLQTLLEAMRPSSWQVSEMTSPTAGRTDKEITGMVRAEMRQRVPGLARSNGAFCPSNLARVGLGSNMSIVDGPPPM